MGNNGSLGPVRTWSLAAGGMVGGGIYIALGVVIEAAGQWAWLSFVLAGIAAVITAWSYARLTLFFAQSGGAFEFLEGIHRKGWAGSLSWLLILGYVLTISVYAYAFGNYIAHAFGGGELLIRGLSLGIMLAMIVLNLAGAGKLTSVEVVIVSGNLLVLLGLAIFGVWGWEPAQLSAGIEAKPPSSALMGAAAIFVSYEGFQLLTYEYDEMDSPQGWFVRVLVSASIFVVAVYTLVALGATMISGAGVVVENKDVALLLAAHKAFGTAGTVVMAIAAGFATTAAINSTLFSTSKLVGRVADDEELPSWFAHRNSNGIVDRAVIIIGVIATLLSMFGSLSTLVEAASLIFVITFMIVNVIAAKKLDAHKWLAWLGAALSAGIGVALVVRLVEQHPITVAILLGLSLAIVGLRPWLLRLKSSS